MGVAHHGLILSRPCPPTVLLTLVPVPLCARFVMGPRPDVIARYISRSSIYIGILTLSFLFHLILVGYQPARICAAMAFCHIRDDVNAADRRDSVCSVLRPQHVCGRPWDFAREGGGIFQKRERKYTYLDTRTVYRSNPPAILALGPVRRRGWPWSHG